MASRQAFLFTLFSAIVLGAIGACDDSGKGGGSGGSAGSGGSGGSGGSSACGQEACAGVGDACGTFADSCGQSVTCNLCRYSGEEVAPTTPSALALAAGKSVQVAYAPEITLATRGAPWTTESIDPASSDRIDMAQAPDGTPWVVFIDDKQLRVAKKSGGAWSVETLPGEAYEASIAVASDGTPHVAWLGTGMDLMFGVRLSSLTNGAWTEKVAAMIASRVDIAVNGNEPQLIYWDANTKTLSWARSTAGGFETEVAATDVEGSGTNINIALAVDADGRPHIAYTLAVVGSDPLRYTVRDGGAWIGGGVAGDAEQGDKSVRIALSAGGEPVIGFMGRQGLTIAVQSGAAWLTQVIHPRCSDSDPFDIAFDASGALGLAHACGGKITFLQRTGLYPEGYAATCAATGSALCNRGCDCTNDGSGDCCMHTSDDGNGNGTCAGPLWYCEEHVTAIVCGDATQDPALVDACSAEAAAGQCATVEPGMVLPAPCAVFF